jgi:hypothetical protein
LEFIDLVRELSYLSQDEKQLAGVFIEERRIQLPDRASLLVVAERNRYLHTYATMNIFVGEDSAVHNAITSILITEIDEVMERDGNHWEKTCIVS